MQKAFNVGERLFFDVLIICLISFVYFKTVPINNVTFFIGSIICLIYFGINFYMGYKNNLKASEALIVGIMGCGVGIFLSFFAIYVQVVLNCPNTAVWILMPYFISTTPIIDFFYKDITILYAFQIMLINILLVIFGSIIKNIVNRLINKS
ncbi:hypothetical protein [Romboutsia lituseburensis]|uniref:hypothetical protein n=1 Tax=Romboutsia lituseburensis TaxID=1537 RepID=UPI0022EB689E|nr:hypothetical protein [Romboutsia lituseburensis]